MPRPDKEISPGRLDGPTSSSRSSSWTKYGGPETVEGHRGVPSSVEPILEITVDDITVTDRPEMPDSKYTTRGTAAYGAGLADEDLLPKKPAEVVREWVVDRVVEGREYRRTDLLVTVQLDA